MFFFFFKMCSLIWHYVIFYLPINRSGTNFAHNWAYVVCGNINKCIFINKYINVFLLDFTAFLLLLHSSGSALVITCSPV